ncbi:MAG: S66 peptidase family protein [Bacteroidales bacterium]
MSSFILPPYLTQGDTIGICAMAGKVTEVSLQFAISTLKTWGLNVQVSPNIYGSCQSFSGSDVQRAEDLQAFINNPNIKAIISARGGYGCARILPLIDLSPLKDKPKWIIGYSDITAIHCALQGVNIASLHATMPINFDDAQGLESLQMALFNEDIGREIAPHLLNVPGVAQGRLIGGNLSVLYSLQGTPYEFVPDNTILFIEDVGEYLYHLDRMMTNLKLSGKLSKIKGLIVGGMTNMEDNKDSFAASAYEVIYTHCADLNIPIVFQFPAGHQKPNMAMCFGRTIRLEVTKFFAQLQYL